MRKPKPEQSEWHEYELTVTEAHLEKALRARESYSESFTANCLMAQAAKEQYEEFESCGVGQIVLNDTTFTCSKKMKQLIVLFEHGQCRGKVDPDCPNDLAQLRAMLPCVVTFY